MAKNLVIVESPAKARTIERFLSADYKVVASMGHIRDLPKSKLGVDVEHNFEPQYVVPKTKSKVVKDLRKEANKAHQVILATDEDREGEAIAWHLAGAIKLSIDSIKRVVFHEVTKEAILSALKSPRGLDVQRVDAQQARRILDRLVGYKLSPFLWFKVMPGLSAGRVQSVAVRMIVERERERQAFEAQEYWSMEGLFQESGSKGKKTDKFTAQLHSLDGEKAEITSQKQAEKIEKALEAGKYNIEKIEKKQRKRNPYPPFVTSTLQQEAARKLGFSAKKTMFIAQQLYEGIELGDEGRTGLITYMRTDSVHLAAAAVKLARDVIADKFGKDYLPVKPRTYKTKAKGAQEAHEAIRPSFLDKSPESLQSVLSKDQIRLYELIYKRTVACQMATAVFDQTKVEIKGDLEVKSQKSKVKSCLFRVTGSVLKFPGFLAIYDEGKDDVNHKEKKTSGKDKKEDKRLPALTEGEDLDLHELLPEQHFTQPPPRYTEATLVKALEEHAIGRPSTYAPTISTIRDRGYVRMEQKRFVPEDVGMVVNDLLVEHFSNIVDIDFTAKMELDLDAIAQGEKTWVPVIREFYDPFAELLERKTKEVKKREVMDEKTDEVCEKCGEPMVIRLGKYGKFLACTGYPECKNTKQLEKEEGAADENAEEGGSDDDTRKEPCEKCGAPMVKKRGRFGQFWGCSAYPECKNIQSLFKPKPIGVKCPDCGGEMVTKKTRKGKIFYGCEKYPKCKHASWQRPEA